MRSCRPFLRGMTGLNAFNADTQAQLPDREPREMKQTIGGSERNAVIRANGLGQTALLKQALEGRESKLFLIGSMASHKRRKREA